MPNPAPLTNTIALWREKVNISTESYRDLSGNEHLTAFMVAGAAQVAMVDDLRVAVDKAIEQGTTREEFKKDFRAIAEARGWAYTGSEQWRSNLIYQTNLWQAHRAGRYAQMTDPIMLLSRPYWQVTEGKANEPRHDHLPFEGKVYPATSEFWDTHFFPIGYGCTHRVLSLSEADVKRLGLTVEEPPKVGDTITVDGQAVEVKTDPQWGDQPPAITPEQRILIVEQMAQRMPTPARAALTRYLEDIQRPLNDGDADTFIRDALGYWGVKVTADTIERVKAIALGTTKPALAAAVLEVVG